MQLNYNYKKIRESKCSSKLGWPEEVSGRKQRSATPEGLVEQSHTLGGGYSFHNEAMERRNSVETGKGVDDQWGSNRLNFMWFQGNHRA